MNYFKNIYLSLLLTVAVGLTAWTAYLSNLKPELDSDFFAGRPDAYMEGVNTTIINKLGNISMIVETPKLVHFSEKNTSHLLKPTVHLYRDSTTPWVITSHYGSAKEGIETVKFWEDVVINHAADESVPQTTIKTPSLLVYPNKQIAETSEAITLTQPYTTIKAVGMHANIDTGEVRLLSKARGEYAPN